MPTKTHLKLTDQPKPPTDSLEEPIPASRYRWLQFRLRTVLLGTVVLCLPLGWLSIKLERTRRQRRAVIAITNAGGFVWYLAQDAAAASKGLTYDVLPYDSQRRDGNALDRLVEEATAGDVVAVSFDESEVAAWNFVGRGIQSPTAARAEIEIDGQEVSSDSSDRWILHGQLDRYGRNIIGERGGKELDWRDLQVLPALEVLSMGHQSIGSAEMEQISKLKQLRCLLIYNGRNVTDDELTHLSALIKLRVLVIDKSSVTDDGLRHLTPLTQLAVLELDHAPIRGDGLSYLADKSHLKLISLRFTPLEDAGLAQLAGLTGLQRLYFFNTQVTDGALNQLAHLRALQVLHLGKTHVTFQGANAFEEKLGRIMIIR